MMKRNILDKLEREDSAFIWKRRFLVMACLMRMFLTGVEYSVIMPSVWLYLKTFSVSSWYLGVVGASYSLATMISLPLAGRFYDRTKRAKELIMVMNVFEIVGNIVYSLHYSPWFPLVGRTIAGIGDGFYVVIFSEIPSVFRRKNITRMFAILEFGSITGIVLGPSFNLFLQKIDFWLGKWHINYATSPGLIMAILWTVMQIVTIFMVNNLYLQYMKPTRKDSKSRDKPMVEEGSEVSDSDDDQKPLVENDATEEKGTVMAGRVDEDSFSLFPSTWTDSLREICTIEVALIIFIDCILWLSQIELEILAPLVGEEDLKFSETSISFFYIVGGVQLLFVFTIIGFLSGKFQDVNYIIISLTLTTLAMLLLGGYQLERHNFKVKLIFACAVAYLIFSAIPINLVAGRSVLIKMTPKHNQGLTLGVYSAICRIALILGPILGSASFPNLIPLSIVMTIFCIAALIGIFICRTRIIERQKNTENIN